VDQPPLRPRPNDARRGVWSGEGTPQMGQQSAGDKRFATSRTRSKRISGVGARGGVVMRGIGFLDGWVFDTNAPFARRLCQQISSDVMYPRLKPVGFLGGSDVRNGGD